MNKNDKILVVDCSIRGAAIGLYNVDDEVSRQVRRLAEWVAVDSLGSSRLLADEVERLLVANGVGWVDVRKVITGIGPGSFTGIKVGISFCQGLVMGMADRCRIQGVSILTLMAELEPNKLVLLKATKNQGYYSYCDGRGSANLGIVDMRQNEIFVDADGQPFAADGYPKITALPWPEGQSLTANCEDFDYPGRVTEILDLAANQCWLDSDSDVAPLYLRKSAPEEKLNDKS